MKNLSFLKSALFVLFFVCVSFSSMAECMSGVLNPCLGRAYTYTVSSQYYCSNVSWEVQNGTIVSSSNYSITIIWTDYNAGVEVLSGCYDHGKPLIGCDLAISPRQCSGKKTAQLFYEESEQCQEEIMDC